MPASQTSMSELNLPLLYRHILRAAQRFPSIKRDSIVQEIKAEFAANKVRMHSMKMHGTHGPTGILTQRWACQAVR